MSFLSLTAESHTPFPHWDLGDAPLAPHTPSPAPPSLRALWGQASSLLPRVLPSRGWEPEPGSAGGRGARTRGTKVVRKRRRCLMFPSATSLGNLLLKSVRKLLTLGGGGDPPSTAPQTFPSRAAYREELERSSRPRKCRRRSLRVAPARIRPQPQTPGLPTTGRGVPQSILGGVARPAPARTRRHLVGSVPSWPLWGLTGAILPLGSRRPDSTQPGLASVPG